MNNIYKKGFALTEVLMAIAVIIIIGIVAYPLYTQSRQNAVVNQVYGDIAQLQTNIDEARNSLMQMSQQNPTGGGYDILNYMNQSGTLPDDIQPDALNGPSQANNFIGQYDIKGTNLMLQVVTENGQVLWLMSSQNGSTVNIPQLCIDISKQIYPLFNIDYQANGTTITSNGVFSGSQGFNMDTLVNACENGQQPQWGGSGYL